MCAVNGIRIRKKLGQVTFVAATDGNHSPSFFVSSLYHMGTLCRLINYIHKKGILPAEPY